MIEVFPLDNKRYRAAALGGFLGTRTRGVFSAENNLAVRLTGGMGLKVNSGHAWLKKDAMWGVSVTNNTEVPLACQPADNSYSRVDAVVLRLNKILDEGEIVIKQGSPSSNTNLSNLIPPERNDQFDEIYLAAVQIPAKSGALTAERLIDLRLNESYCGLMRDGVSGVPTQLLYDRFEIFLTGLQEAIENITAGTGTMLKAEHEPNATATINDGNLIITMKTAHTVGSYPILFQLDGSQNWEMWQGSVLIDGVNCGKPLSIYGEAVLDLTIKAGVPLSLYKLGSKVYLTNETARKVEAQAGNTPFNPGSNCNALDTSTIYVKEGIVYLSSFVVSVTKTLPAYTYTPVGSLKYHARPKREILGLIGSTGAGNLVVCKIAPDGTVSVNPIGTTLTGTSNVYINVSFPVAGHVI